LIKKPEILEASIGERIKQIRKDVGFSQTDLARKLKFSRQQFLRYESGASRITVSRLMQIAKALGVPVRSFIASEPSVAEEPYIGLDEKEIKLIKRFRKIRDSKFKDHAIFLVDMMTSIQKST
jgi:transcriptional regulator with XRE-family HTH domain